MDVWDSSALDPLVADVVVQLRGLSDLAKGTAMKWNKLYNSAWHEAESLKNANHSCGGSQGCPLQNARCAAAAANLRYKSALHIAMTFMSFTLQGAQSLKANLSQLIHLLQELLSGKLQGSDCFLEEYGAQVQQLLAKIEGFKCTGMNPQAILLNGDVEMKKHQSSQMSDVIVTEVEAVKGLLEQEMDMEPTFKKRIFDGSSMSMEDECRSFQHQEKRRKQRDSEAGLAGLVHKFLKIGTTEPCYPIFRCKRSGQISQRLGARDDDALCLPVVDKMMTFEVFMSKGQPENVMGCLLPQKGVLRRCLEKGSLKQAQGYLLGS